MILIHLGFCFTERTWEIDTLFSDALVKNEIVIQAFFIARWLLQAVIYFLFGRAIIKQDTKQMIILAIAAIVLPIIRYIILRVETINYLWDIICWLIVLCWIGWTKGTHKQNNSFLWDLLVILVGLVAIFVRDYYGGNEIETFTDFLGIYSFVFQDMLRSLAMIFFALWLFVIPKEQGECGEAS